MAFHKQPYGKYRAVSRTRNRTNGSPGSSGRFRVKSPVKTFRDLDVYKNTTALSSEIARLKIPKKLGLAGEQETLRTISKYVPKLIAESYGDKFVSGKLASAKMEQAMRCVTNAVTKLDFMVACAGDENGDLKHALLDVAGKYQTQRRKIFNLKRAWDRVFLASDPLRPSSQHGPKASPSKHKNA